jgi:hypothetical protein
MKMKKLGLFLLAVALSAIAFIGEPRPARAASACNRPVCSLLVPGCCSDVECTAWCLPRGGAPQCFGAGQGGGGCCSCESP